MERSIQYSDVIDFLSILLSTITLPGRCFKPLVLCIQKLFETRSANASSSRLCIVFRILDRCRFHLFLLTMISHLSHLNTCPALNLLFFVYVSFMTVRHFLFCDFCWVFYFHYSNVLPFCAMFGRYSFQSRKALARPSFNKLGRSRISVSLVSVPLRFQECRDLTSESVI